MVFSPPSSDASQAMKKLPLSFYRGSDVAAIGKALLGKGLYTQIDGVLTGGMIIETESYAGALDRASHAYGGRRTARTEVMYQNGGVAYIYLCYGMHHLLNAVTAPEGVPHAALIRAILPTVGIDTMRKRRRKKASENPALLAQGPGALTSALGLDLRHNGEALNGRILWIAEEGRIPQPDQILIGPRVGVDYAGEDANLPYRFRWYPELTP